MGVRQGQVVRRRLLGLLGAALLLGGGVSGCTAGGTHPGAPEPGRTARPERPERPDHPGRPDRPDHPDRPDRPERPDHPALPTLLAPPPAPRVKPALPAAGRSAPVVERVPTRDRVVFLTIDDGLAKDPEFARLMRDLRVPFSMFLTDSMAGDDYGYFDRLRPGGNRVQNHTLTHPSLAGLPYARQRAEICGQQARLEREFGEHPTLFRPPRGHYDRTTLRAAADCGLRACVMWGVNMQPDGLRYDNGSDRLRPGEIVLFHFFPPERLGDRTLTELTVELLRTITEQGYAVARIEDYV
ncbi:polysaccharide deacetylase family protein [Streptomyces sp. B-S-A8]|uniref:Polysaccharide deacetylase family protein n=1 Tax=Streptomyces solicavernae TaxID=3043614 RepID=A0ABT6RKP0_9ACTN|nr:polysaccharide deacetylase family protein [Streptomyces sp. B-S-A8]MDI3385004.1 polysaccharide deacetylase family protein [Streptomyces sp. B-S-A8]